MSVPAVSSPAEQFRQLSDADPEIQTHGAYFSCSYLLDMIEHSYLVRMHRGIVEELIADPGPLESYEFAIRAGRETWEGFCSPVPPPMCHGIWSATFRRDMSLEGDLLVLMQNLRVLTLWFPRDRGGFLMLPLARG